MKPPTRRDNHGDVEVGHCLNKKGHSTEVLIRRGQRRMQYAIDIQKECWLSGPNHLSDLFPALATPLFAVGGLLTVTL